VLIITNAFKTSLSGMREMNFICLVAVLIYAGLQMLTAFWHLLYGTSTDFKVAEGQNNLNRNLLLGIALPLFAFECHIEVVQVGDEFRGRYPKTMMNVVLVSTLITLVLYTSIPFSEYIIGTHPISTHVMNDIDSLKYLKTLTSVSKEVLIFCIKVSEANNLIAMKKIVTEALNLNLKDKLT
jgi:amino acid permease